MSDEVIGCLGYEHKITNQELKLELDKMQKLAHQKAIDEMVSVIAQPSHPISAIDLILSST